MREDVCWMCDAHVNSFFVHVPTCRTFSTQLLSSNFNPLLKLRLCESDALNDDALYWINNYNQIIIMKIGVSSHHNFLVSPRRSLARTKNILFFRGRTIKKRRNGEKEGFWRYTTSHMFGLLVRRRTEPLETEDGRREKECGRCEAKERRNQQKQTDIKTIKHLSLYWCMEWISKLFYFILLVLLPR